MTVIKPFRGRSFVGYAHVFFAKFASSHEVTNPGDDEPVEIWLAPSGKCPDSPSSSWPARPASLTPPASAPRTQLRQRDRHRRRTLCSREPNAFPPGSAVTCRPLLSARGVACGGCVVGLPAGHAEQQLVRDRGVDAGHRDRLHSAPPEDYRGVRPRLVQPAEARPSASHTSLVRCRSDIFMEVTKVRRPRSSLLQGIDRWENSGGRKGSTTWPSEKPRLRCQYGKVTREGRSPLKYNEYTFIHPWEGDGVNQDLTSEVLQRHMYVVMPAGTATGGQRQGQPRRGESHSGGLQDSGGEDGAGDYGEESYSAADGKRWPALLAMERMARTGSVTTDIVTAVMHEVAADTSCAVGRGRPRLLGEKFPPVCIEIGPSCRRFRRTDAGAQIPQMDRWVNAGGKRAVVISKSSQDGVLPLQRRNGKILRPGLQELRYHQYNLGSGSRSAGTVTVYHIFAPAGLPHTTSLPCRRRTEFSHKRQYQSEINEEVGSPDGGGRSEISADSLCEHGTATASTDIPEAQASTDEPARKKPMLPRASASQDLLLGLLMDLSSQPEWSGVEVEVPPPATCGDVQVTPEFAKVAPVDENSPPNNDGEGEARFTPPLPVASEVNIL